MNDADSGPRPISAVEAWQRYDEDEQRLSAHVSERMLDLAQLRPGARVLDVATGRGEPALRAAARVAPGGWVVGTDVSADMLGFAQARAQRMGIGNLTLLATGGEHLDDVPADPPFDAATCRWGFMYFERPVRALESLRQHLVPGGLLVSALWASPDCTPWWSAPRRVLARHVAQPPVSCAAPGPFRYALPDAFRQDLEGAGFAVVHEETMETAVMESTTPDGLVDWCLTFGLASALRGLPEAVRRDWERDMQSEAQRHRQADGMYRLGGTTRLVVARAA